MHHFALSWSFTVLIRLFPVGFKSCNRENYIFYIYRAHWRTHKWLVIKLQRFSSFKLPNKSVMQVKCVHINEYQCLRSVLFIPFSDILLVLPKLLRDLLTKSCVALWWTAEEVLLYPLFSDEITEAKRGEYYFLNNLGSIHKPCLKGCISIVAS